MCPMMKKLIYVLAVLPFVFCACSDLDADQLPDDNNDKSEQVPVVKKLYASENGRQVARIDYDYDSQGRVNHIYLMEGEYMMASRIKYDGNNVELESEEETVSYQCDDQGRLLEVRWSPDNGIPGLTFGYDENGYICSVASIDEDPESESDIIIASGNNYTYMTGYYIEYTDYPNNYSIDMNWMSSYWMGAESFDETYGMKFKNSYSQNLFKSMRDDEIEAVFTYAFDELSNVTDIKCQIFLLEGSECLDEFTIKVEY